ncbi:MULTISPECIES: hypothetical protein [unclassified Caballeronia]|uniref:hypothetical protein n=1 Tax=unclassified Caballeronia TaxID=2646786 RepID=UPI001F32B34D|nr:MULTISPECIES: hypothetical protein [unclassified Caballeronia]MCE4547548.1 hypothetical protein [Caballeronia sp. PC1]MCE4575006.1 hypothetical protein [Caballeronia sp. CLC5]
MRFIKAEGECADAQLQNDIIRLADIAEYELGFETVLHGKLAVVRSRAKRHHPLMALALFDSALTEFTSNVHAPDSRLSDVRPSPPERQRRLAR